MRFLLLAISLFATLGVCASPQPVATPGKTACSPWKQLNEQEKVQAVQDLKKLEAREPELRRKYPLNLALLNNNAFLGRLARGILANETSCKESMFTFWKSTEPFPSLGLTHAIWYPQGAKSNLTESFPDLVQFIRRENKKSSSNIKIPAWLDQDNIGHAPWNNKPEFDVAFKNAEALKNNGDLSSLKSLNSSAYQQAVKFRELQDFLKNPNVLALQARYAAHRIQKSIYNILAVSEEKNQSQDIYSQLQRLTTTEEGIFSLIDYTGFKGEGINPGEVTAIGNHAWGIKTVLENMKKQTPASPFCQAKHPDYHDGKCANIQFTLAAKFALNRLAEHRGEPGSFCQREGLELLKKPDGSRGGWTARLEDNYMPGRLAEIRCPNVELKFTANNTTTSRTSIAN